MKTSKGKPPRKHKTMTQNELTKNDWFSTDEVEALTSTALSKVRLGKSRYSFEKHTNYAILTTLLKTGMRVSELCSLTIPQIQKGLNEGEFLLVGKGGMNTTNKKKIKNSTRLVYINTELKSILETYLLFRNEKNTNKLKNKKISNPTQEQKSKAIKRALKRPYEISEQKHNFLFISRTGEPLTQQKVWARFQTICRQSGVQPRKTHATRHTTGMNLYAKTKDILTTSSILGHKSVTTTQVYVKATEEAKRKAIELL